MLAFVVLAGCVTSSTPSGGQESERGGGQRTLQATVLATDLRRLTSDATQELWPSVSPDGKRLLYSVSQTQQDSTVVVLELASGSVGTPLTTSPPWSGFPTWLADGSGMLLETNARGRYELARAAASTQAEQQVVVPGDAAAYPRHPSPSSDGKLVAFAADVSGKPNLGLVGLDGAALRFITEGDYPSWSPDGRRIAFTRVIGGHSQVFVVDPFVPTLAVQLTYGEMDSGQPAWSPDSQWIVFSSNRAGGIGAASPYGQQNSGGFGRRGGGRRYRQTPRRSYNLFAMKQDGSQLAQLTQGTADSQMPAWGSDGFLYFASNAAETFDLWRLRPQLIPAATPAAPATPGPGL